MNKHLFLQGGVVLLWLATPSGAAAQVANPESSHNYSVSAPNYSIRGPWKSIHEVKFRNLTLYAFGDKGPPEFRFVLRAGEWRQETSTEKDVVRLNSVHYLASGQGPDLALIQFDWEAITAGFWMTSYAQVFELRDGELRVTQQVRWDTTQVDPPSFLFEPRTYSFILRAEHFLNGDAHCCVSAMDVVRYVWDGVRFVRQASKTILTEFGKREGKKLPPS